MGKGQAGGTPIDLDKLRSIGVIGRRTRPQVTEGRRGDGVRTKTTTTEAGTVVEHASKDDRVDAYARPETVRWRMR